MKGLAIYSLIVIAVAYVGLIGELFAGIDIETNLWAIALFLPIVYFFIKYLQGK